MKITFGHLNLCYPKPGQIQIQFEAETEFEREYLKSLVNLQHEFGPFEWIHPGDSKHGRAVVVAKSKPETT